MRSVTRGVRPMPDIQNKGLIMRFFVTAEIAFLTAIMGSPAQSHVLIPAPYEKRQSEAHLIVIAETIQSTGNQSILKNLIEFKVLSTLKGPRRSILRVSRKTLIQEESLTCCTGPGRYILFLRRGRNGLYESVNGDYGAVRLAE